ncbi:hypothetical protein PV371_38110 [Streptomyces sp. TX20-6-3]|uniref:hypothetical protein n=1 Tax=Streptomyces sp. TX20-6-3 TaxID=3028705 RepID=UPI0029B11F0A|nr:hypothetical protein [Streptomyces sp. TX20-6-3]MDX2565371.1 hypothetical protein [Streptomyces sp. TX20-6-3]
MEAYLQLEQQHDRAKGPDDGDWAHLAGLLGEAAPVAASEPGTWASMQFRSGQRQATNAQTVDDDPQRLFTEAVLHGLKDRLCDDVASLDDYLPPRVAELARKADVLEELQLATT